MPVNMQLFRHSMYLILTLIAVAHSVVNIWLFGRQQIIMECQTQFSMVVARAEQEILLFTQFTDGKMSNSRVCVFEAKLMA